MLVPARLEHATHPIRVRLIHSELGVRAPSAVRSHWPACRRLAASNSNIRVLLQLVRARFFPIGAATLVNQRVVNRGLGMPRTRDALLFLEEASSHEVVTCEGKKQVKP